MSEFRWGTVAQLSPLRILLDGDDTPLAFTPESLVDPRDLVLAERVRCELSGQHLLILGHMGGAIRTATAAIPGLVELATNAETRAGTDTVRAVTPAGLRSSMIPIQGQTPSSVVVGSGSASVASDATVTVTGASSIACNGVFDGLGGDGYEIFGVLLGSTDLGGSLQLRHRGSGVDVTTGHYFMEGGGIASSWGSYTTRGSSAANVGGYIIGFRQYTSFRLQLLRPNQAFSKEMTGTTSGDGTNQVSGWLQGRTSFTSAHDGFKIFPANGTTPLTGWVKVVKIS